MRLSRVLPVAIIFISLVFITLLSAEPSNAATLQPSSPRARLSSTALGATPQLNTDFNIYSPSSNFASAVTYIDGDFTVATDAATANGAVMGTIFANPTTLAIGAGGCFTTILPLFTMMDATTGGTTIPPAGPATDLLRNLAEDNFGAGGVGPANGLPDHVDAYPSYLNTLLDPDGPGGAAPITPRARYSGFTVVSNVTVILQLLIFNPGALRSLPNAGAAVASLGYPSLVVLQDPTVAPNNSSISDFCSRLGSATTLFGRAHDNSCTPIAGRPAACTTAVGPSTLIKAVDGGCPGATVPDESGGGACTARLTNPGSAQTVQFTLQAHSARDFDGDGIENSLDPCPRTWSDTDGVPDTTTTDHWDPRAISNPTMDTDADGLDQSCDPADEDSPGDTTRTDEDDDGWLNRLDNCGVSPRNGGARLRQATLSIVERHVDSTVNSAYDGGEAIYLDVAPLGTVNAGDVLVFGTAVANGTALIAFNSDEKHLDTNWTAGEATSRAGVYKRALADANERIYRDTGSVIGYLDATDTRIDDNTGAPPAGVNGDALLRFLPEAKHITVNNTSGLQNGDNITVGNPSTEGGADTEIDRNNFQVARAGVDGILSYDQSGDAQAVISTDGISALTNVPATIKFPANGNRGQADFDIPFPLQVADGGTRGDTIGPASAADVGCDLAGAQPAGPLGNTVYGTDGPTVPDGRYHRTATISRVCVGGTDADGDGVCTDIDPSDANIDSDADNATGEGGGAEANCLDTVDNDGDGGFDTADTECAAIDGSDDCISTANAAPAGMTQADKDSDGIGDACDMFHDSDGDGFSDRLENAAEEGTFCNNSSDDDSDGAVNDGCARAGDAEAACGASGDTDTDTYDNDGCPSVGTVSTGTLAMIACAGPLIGGVGPRTSPSPTLSNPADFNGDNVTDITDIGLVAADFGKSTGVAVLGERGDIGPDVPVLGLGGGVGDATIDITDIGVIAGLFGATSC